MANEKEKNSHPQFQNVYFHHSPVQLSQEVQSVPDTLAHWDRMVLKVQEVHSPVDPEASDSPADPLALDTPVDPLDSDSQVAHPVAGGLRGLRVGSDLEVRWGPSDLQEVMVWSQDLDGSHLVVFRGMRQVRNWKFVRLYERSMLCYMFYTTIILQSCNFLTFRSIVLS